MAKKVVKKKQRKKSGARMQIPPVIDALQEKLEQKRSSVVSAGYNKFSKIQLRDIYRLCIAGYSDTEIADLFRLSSDRWRALTNAQERDYCPELVEALWRGRDAAVSRVAAALEKRATGWKHKATKFFVIDGDIVSQEYIESYPGDVAAQKFFLMNKRPDQWKERQEVSGPDGAAIIQPTINIVTDEAKIKQLMKAKDERNTKPEGK